MAKIERVEDLPEWFDLEKYQGSECFEVGDWYRQLLERQSLFNACLGLKAPKPAYGSDYDWYADAAEEMRDAPLELDEEVFYLENKRRPVRVLRAYDLVHSASEEQYRQGITGRVDISVLFKGTHESGIEVLIAGSQYLQPTLIVDLGASDSTLRESFAIWLQGARKSRDAVAVSRNKPAWNRWSRYGLLPYLDLLIWSMETETNIPDRVMSAAISSYDAGEANLRKTVAPLADSLMQDLSGLQSLVALEAAAQVKSETFQG